MDKDRKNSVLIVDDDDFNLEILRSFLDKEYTVYSANNGQAAIGIAMDASPDLILLDIIMPDIGGFDVLTTLKRSEKTKNIPVIIITGLENVEDEEKGLDLEAVDYIHKPFSVKIVRLKVRNQMQIVNHLAELNELQKKLEAAVIDAETANKAKSSFLARMSHEIRTPLNAVLGISEIQLQNKNLAQDVKEAFIRIFDSGDLLLKIINDILDISKIEAGKMEMILERYNFSDMINDTVYLSMIKYENKGIEFVLDIDENIPQQLVGDEIRIKQILNNILSNAFKYTDAGKVELSLSSHFDGDAVVLVFRVRDTGQGMTRDQLEKLFDDYSRFNMEANRTTVGTGLGMGIAQNLIRMMNGDITAESERGRGTLFTILIPQGGVGAAVLGKEGVEKLKQFRNNFDPKMKNAQVSREPIPFAKLLVVDDIDMNLYVIKGMLSPYGFQIDTASSGFEAIEKIKESYANDSLYDIVFMDHMMPVMDGIETVRQIKLLGPEINKVPIVALTANAIAGMKNKFLSNGFSGYISKPVNMDELDAVLREWISPGKILGAGNLKNTGDEATEIDLKFFEDIGGIGEIDAEVGLNHLSRSKAAYRDTLEKFSGKIDSECNSMSAFLEARNLNNFLISIHAMKSMLAIVGAVELSEKAHQLELASINNELEYCLHKYSEFKRELFLLHDKLAVITPVCSQSDSEAPEEPADSGDGQDVSRVLLVDDMEMMLEIVKNKLERYGMRVDTATRGKEAIEKAKNNTYDIIFMDYLMPGMDGIEATAQIRKWENENNARKNIIIALTADEDSNKVEKFIGNGFNDYLFKPVETQKLKEILLNFCPSLPGV